MGRACVAAGAIAIAALGIVGDIRPADAAIVYPWCVRARISEVGAPSCGFASYAQCIASFAGGVGTCTENPFYSGPMQAQSGNIGRH